MPVCAPMMIVPDKRQPKTSASLEIAQGLYAKLKPQASFGDGAFSWVDQLFANGSCPNRLCLHQDRRHQSLRFCKLIQYEPCGHGCCLWDSTKLRRERQ